MLRRLTVLLLLCSVCVGAQLKPTRGSLFVDRGNVKWRGLIGSWLMNEGGGDTVYDSSGNGMDLDTWTGTNTWTSGVFGPAIRQPAGIHHIGTSKSSSIYNFAGKRFTVSVRVTPEDMGNLDGVFYFTEDGSSDYIKAQISSVNMSGYLYDGSDVVDWAIVIPAGPLRPVLNQEIQYTWVFDLTAGMVCYGYINGQYVGTDSEATVLDFSGDWEFRLGYTNRDFAGLFHNTQIYNRVLSASEISRLYIDSFWQYRQPPIWSVAGGEPPATGNTQTRSIGPGVGAGVGF